MPLNYDKWAALELSDDSDIETHPNVDKKSMIRWKQRDIHEKRQLRKLKIEHLGLEHTMNAGLLLRVDSLIASTESLGPPFVAQTLAELHAKVPDYATKKFKEGEQPSEDHMILSLLTQVVNKVKEGGGDVGGEKGKEAILKELAEHKRKLVERQKDVLKERKEEEEEQKKHITSEDMHVGWDSKTMISSTPSAIPQGPTSSAAKGKKKETRTETVIETINSPGVTAAAAAEEHANADADSDNSSDEADAPPLTPSALAFSKLAPLDFPGAFAAISKDPTLLSEDTTDALLVEAFSVAMKGSKGFEQRARQCVEKGLIIQYCLQLGRDGVSLYFKRMTSTDPKALKMYLEDVSATTNRIVARAKVVAAEQAASRASDSGKEQIQLVASDPSTVISFEVPDGPPPEKLEITGEGAEQFDPERVREFLTRRWEIFESFPKGLKKALGEKSLEKVNKVLGKMEVEEAEEVVRLLQEGGILSFEQNDIVDTTKGEQIPVRQPQPEETAEEVDVANEVD